MNTNRILGIFISVTIFGVSLFSIIIPLVVMFFAHGFIVPTSMTKAVTAVGAMILYERGLFQLNDPISKYVPEYADMMMVSEVNSNGDASAVVAATTPIKIIDLFTHSSGLSYPFASNSVQSSYVMAGIIDGMTSRETTLATQMKLLAIIFVIIFTLTNCGKKSEPKYQGKLNQIIITI